MTKYPAPDVKGFLKRLTVMATVMLFFHEGPDAYVWFSSNVLGREVVLNARRAEFILLVAYVICGIGVVTEFVGLTWALVRQWRQQRR